MFCGGFVACVKREFGLRIMRGVLQGMSNKGAVKGFKFGWQMEDESFRAAGVLFGGREFVRSRDFARGDTDG